MNLDEITLSNLKSRFDSYAQVPVDQDVLAWNSTNARFEPESFKTVSSQSVIGAGNIEAGGTGAFVVVDYIATTNQMTSGFTDMQGDPLVAGKTILLTAQTSATTNGIYVFDAAGDLTLQGELSDADYVRQYFFAAAGTNQNAVFFCTNMVTQSAKNFERADFQNKLVSGINFSTLNGQPLLGSGNITISGGASTGTSEATGVFAHAATHSSVAPTVVFKETVSGSFTGQFDVAILDAANASVSNMAEPVNQLSSIPAGGGASYFGKVFIFWLKDVGGPLSKWKLCRVYRKAASNLFAQTGTLDAAGNVTWNAEVDIGIALTYIYDVKPVGNHRFVLVGGSNTIGSRQPYIWTYSVWFSGDTTVNTRGEHTTVVAGSGPTGTFGGAMIHDMSLYYGSGSATAWFQVLLQYGGNVVFYGYSVTESGSTTSLSLSTSLQYAVSGNMTDPLPNQSLNTLAEIVRIGSLRSLLFFTNVSGNHSWYDLTHSGTGPNGTYSFGAALATSMVVGAISACAEENTYNTDAVVVHVASTIRNTATGASNLHRYTYTPSTKNFVLT